MLALFLASGLQAQTMGEISFGTSTQDLFAGQITIRRQFSERFRAGLSVQAGAPQYRFIGAKLLSEGGYAATVTAPLTWELSRQEGIQLYGLLRPGLRFQGIIDPDENDQRDSILSSTALLLEPGLLVNLPISSSLHLQSGATFPIGYEISPETLLEYQWVNLHGGLSYAAKRQVWFVRANAGSAFGASGDTYKFMWSLQAGVRFSFGSQPGSFFHLIESTTF